MKSDEIYSPSFMEWGIITKKNFEGKSTYDIPIKRWDPLTRVAIKTEAFGAHEKKIRYTGHYAYISPIRGKRPKGFVTSEKKSEIVDCSKRISAKAKDVFMSITEGKIVHDNDGKPIGDGNTIILCQDEERIDNPFEDTPHKIKKLPDNCGAITLINRYPSMARIIDPEVENYLETKLPPHIKLARGVNLITLSRHFYPSTCFNLIPEDILAKIFLSMKESIIFCIEEATGQGFYDIPVSPFFNVGMKVGGSQPRIHGQVYIDLSMDGHGTRLEGYLEAFKEMKNCHLCETTHGNTDRIILKSEYWTFYTTGSPVRNYHIRFHPNEHIRRFSQLNINQIRDLAIGLKRIFYSLDQIKVEQNRNIIFNCCPFHYDTDFHLFGDIIPHEIIGGAEMAEDMRVARKLPNLAAKEIRDTLKELE